MAVGLSEVGTLHRYRSAKPWMGDLSTEEGVVAEMKCRVMEWLQGKSDRSSREGDSLRCFDVYGFRYG
jgi:hypothetical protein